MAQRSLGLAIDAAVRCVVGGEMRVRSKAAHTGCGVLSCTHARVCVLCLHLCTCPVRERGCARTGREFGMRGGARERAHTARACACPMRLRSDYSFSIAGLTPGQQCYGLHRAKRRSISAHRTKQNTRSLAAAGQASNHWNVRPAGAGASASPGAGAVALLLYLSSHASTSRCHTSELRGVMTCAGMYDQRACVRGTPSAERTQ